ncbi:hypothetical protein A6R68_20791 [Neotoma lepida]|uniref:Uncharacterized protein n=1 Tax=Neotoma lepida TaxID=56216 RepID=A0A1A6HRZ9_NEOLE|nr:hypothetical protein A6R68_20791 [Neotoma lepida]
MATEHTPAEGAQSALSSATQREEEPQKPNYAVKLTLAGHSAAAPCAPPQLRIFSSATTSFPQKALPNTQSTLSREKHSSVQKAGQHEEKAELDKAAGGDDMGMKPSFRKHVHTAAQEDEDQGETSRH